MVLLYKSENIVSLGLVAHKGYPFFFLSRAIFFQHGFQVIVCLDSCQDILIHKINKYGGYSLLNIQLDNKELFVVCFT